MLLFKTPHLQCKSSENKVSFIIYKHPNTVVLKLFLPWITNPNRITLTNCALIDHIYTKFPAEELTSCILVNDLSDPVNVFLFIKYGPFQK